MPWDIRKRGSEWCVFKEGTTSDPLGCHPTEEKARQQVRALHANEASRDDEASTFASDVLADAEVASRALDGDVVLVYPKGKHYRQNMFTGAIREWEVDDDTVKRIVDNYMHRRERGIRQGRIPVNIDHGSSRAVGWYKDVVELPGGVGASFTWNKKGREALRDGEFAYFSVEIYDRLVDRVTAEVVQDQLFGGALTNYPFFGDEAALMSRGSSEGTGTYTGGLHMEDGLEHGEGVTDRTLLLRIFDHIIGDRRQQKAAGDLDHGADGDDTVIAGMQERIQEMANQISQFTAELGKVTSERDSYAAKVDEATAQIAAMHNSAAAAEHRRLAESYANLPAKTDELAGHLLWLSQADVDGEHAQFFRDLFSAANTALGVYFTSVGVKQGATLSNDDLIDQAVTRYMSENKGVSYRQALDAVMAEHPEFDPASGGA